MKVWYDTEFLEDGRTIELISIGLVREDGKEYYAVHSGMPWRRIQRHPWLMQNVIPHLPLQSAPQLLIPDWSDPVMKCKDTIAREVLEFLLPDLSEPELWAYYAAYDHVVLAQLWGRMIDIPWRLPMYTNDIRQEIHRLGNPMMPVQAGGDHHALADARHNKVMYDFLKER